MAELSSPVLGGLFVALALYQLVLFVRQRRGVHLWLAATAVAGGTAAACLARWGFAGPWTAVALHAVAILVIELLAALLGRGPGRWLRAYQLSLLVIGAAWPWLPAATREAADPWRLLWIVPLMVGIPLAMGLAARAGHVEAILATDGAVAFGLAGLVEIAFRMLGLGSTQPLPAWAFLFFTFAVAMALSERFGGAYHELRSLREHLERMVDDRTDELSQANTRLEAEIAERRLAEEAMRMLERAVEQSVDGLLVTDAAGGTQFLNQAWARMHGYEPAQVLGHEMRLYHTPEQLQGELHPALEEVRRTGAFEGEVGHRRRDGSTFPTWTSVTLLLDPGGEPAGFVMFARDITARREAACERQRLEEKVQRLQRFESLASLAGAVGHDYNNLLTGVLGNAALARRELAETSPVYAHLRQIEGAAERAVDLTGQLLAYAGEHPPQTRTLDVGELVDELRPKLAEIVGDRARLEIHHKRHLPAIQADPAQLRQVLESLVANAADAVEDGDGVVSVRTTSRKVDRSYLADTLLDEGQPEGTYVLLSVSDTGVGMDEATRERMFDPFFSTKSDARGLGLAAVLGIVRGHAGTLRVFSRPRRGTTLELLFPAVGELETEPTFVDTAEGLARWRSSGTVLVIDDEKILRDLSREILTRHGFDVLVAESGPDGVALFRDHASRIRLVLLDRTMPLMNGESVYRELRAIDPEIAVILMSGYQESDVLAGFGEGGLAGFLQKPFRPEQLLARVREVLPG